MTSTLTIQAYILNVWCDIAELHFDESYRLTAMAYTQAYSFQHYLADNNQAVSINYPIELFSYSVPKVGWLAFLDDILPSGAGRRYWLKHLALQGLSEAEQNYRLLRYATIAPIGHLRIKQAVEAINIPISSQKRFFDEIEVVNRHADFLDYANQYGAIAGGATGAGGEAPKLILRVTADEQVWIDHLQIADSEDAYYLVKFPRGQRTAIDCDILRAEYHYYQELTAMGFNTIATQGMRLIEGERYPSLRYPSLWLPRFDIRSNGNSVERLAMESVYSMLQQPPATRLNHGQAIRQLIELIENSNIVANGFVFNKQQFVIEWVERDLLNIAFGNSDNHGRNTAFLRNSQGIWLAPIFDFAPMKADPDGIPRSMVWGQANGKVLESGGKYDFVAITHSLADLVPPERLLNQLRQTAKKLIDLPKRLQQRGVSESILNYPAIGFKYLPTRLKNWGLLP